MAKDLRSATPVEKFSFKKSLRQRRKMLQPQKSGMHEGEDDITDAGLAELTGTTGDPDDMPKGGSNPYAGPERRKKDRRGMKAWEKQREKDRKLQPQKIGTGRSTREDDPTLADKD